MKEQAQKDTVKLSPLLIGGITIGLVAITGIVIYVVRKRKAGASASKVGSAKRNTGSFQCLYKSYPLRYGSCGNEVKILQRHLNKKGASVDEDGKFGPLTKTASIKYLKSEQFGKSFIEKITA